MSSRFSLSALRAASLVIIFGSLSCGGGTEPTPNTNDVRSIITGVTSEDGLVIASFHTGSAPTGGSGPVATVIGSSAMILGGAAIRTVTSTSAFTRIIVAIQELDGYWELTLPSATTSYDIILSIAQVVARSTFSVEYAVGTSGAVGSFDSEFVAIVTVGTGDIQVSVSWDVESDVDLHVVEPGGAEIYYAESQSISGGVLDLDSNAACFIDHVRNENITWPNTAPPHGTYTVRVDYFDACGVAATQYVVTIRVKGQNPVTHTGTLTGLGDNGGAGSGQLIATFTY